MKLKLPAGRAIVSFFAVLVMAFSASVVFAGHLNNETSQMTTTGANIDDENTTADDASQRTVSREPTTNEDGDLTFTNAAGDVIIISRENLAENPFTSQVEEADDEQDTTVTGSSVRDDDLAEGKTFLCTVEEMRNTDEEILLRCEADTTTATTGTAVDDTQDDLRMEDGATTGQAVDDPATTQDRTQTTDTTENDVDQEMMVADDDQDTTTGAGTDDNKRSWWNPFNWFRND